MLRLLTGLLTIIFAVLPLSCFAYVLCSAHWRYVLAVGGVLLFIAFVAALIEKARFG
jgi:hypothetical protein